MNLRAASSLARRLSTSLLGLAIAVPGASVAAPLPDRSGLCADATILTFDGLAHEAPIADQFASSGVTFAGIFHAHDDDFHSIWPGSGAPVAANFGACCSEFGDVVVASFDPPVTKVGFEVISNQQDFVELRAYRNGVLVDSFNFDPRLVPATFVGLHVPGGFDTLEIDGNGPVNGSWALDDFTFCGRCGNGQLDDGEECDDGARTGTTASCCSATCRVVAAEAECDDGNACTGSDRCDGQGECVGSDPVVCEPLDQCHDAGTCDPASGCSHPPKTEGTPCEDGAWCTVGDACVGGTCRSMPRDCSAAGGPCRVGTCDDEADQCVGAPRADGTACTDQNACTLDDTCQGGECAPGDPTILDPANDVDQTIECLQELVASP